MGGTPNQRGTGWAENSDLAAGDLRNSQRGGELAVGIFDPLRGMITQQPGSRCVVCRVMLWWYWYYATLSSTTGVVVLTASVILVRLSNGVAGLLPSALSGLTLLNHTVMAEAVTLASA